LKLLLSSVLLLVVAEFLQCVLDTRCHSCSVRFDPQFDQAIQQDDCIAGAAAPGVLDQSICGQILQLLELTSSWAVL
jgi:hypothetical protein